MIIVQLSGGFGNQLFQYAAGLSLAEYHNVKLKIDSSLLHKPDSITGTQRKIDIHNLARQPLEATKDEIASLTSSSFLKSFIDKMLPFHKRSIYKEKSNKYDRSFFSAGSSTYLKGNRQSEKYFKLYSQKIRSEFTLNEQCVEPVKAIAQQINKPNSVSIHVRRGDYLTPIAQEWLGILPLAYYENAIDNISQVVLNPKFFIFSDDIEWCRTNLKIEFEHEFISGILSHGSMQDFYLMSQCGHNIIANSTFSWWAAWLNNNTEKVVIAPKSWYQKPGLDTSDLIPAEWIRL